VTAKLTVKPGRATVGEPMRVVLSLSDEVDLARASRVMAAIDALGWSVAPLHLGPRAWSAVPRAGG